MGKKCFVPNCRSGYQRCVDHVPLFKAPSEPARLELWRRAIPRADRILQPSDCVCAKHFPEQEISKSYYAEFDGQVLLNVPKKRPVLSANAVPSIFPGCPKYLTKQTASRKPPRKRKSADPCAQQPSKRPAPTAVALPTGRAGENQKDAVPTSSRNKKLRTDNWSTSCKSGDQGTCPSATINPGGTPSSTSSIFRDILNVKVGSLPHTGPGINMLGDQSSLYIISAEFACHPGMQYS